MGNAVKESGDSINQRGPFLQRKMVAMCMPQAAPQIVVDLGFLEEPPLLLLLVSGLWSR